MNHNIREKIFSIFKMENSEPKIELNYTTPFQLLIAVLLSAQTKDQTVNIVTSKLFPAYGSPESLVNLDRIDLENSIKIIGLYRKKAENILRSSKIILDEYNGKVPNSRRDLERLPGIGRKSANVILNVLFNQSTVAVDTHVFRVSNRIGIAVGKNVLELEENLLKKIPEKYKKKAHHWLVLHGRYTCTARRPKCYSCKIFALCEFKDKSLYSSIK